MSEAKKGETYNYPRFKMSNYELGYFPGPKAGSEANYDYTLTDLEGNEVSLSDYKGKWLVIESGSMTCPMYVKNVKAFSRLKEKYSDVEWLVVYVREAHPGEKTGQASSINEKIDYARRNKEYYNENRRIIVDSVDGKWHHDWGLLPNTVYVINPQGTVIYRADWSFANRVDKVLQNREQINTDEHIVIIGAAPWITIPVTMKGGWIALYDILIIFPKIFYEHFKLDIQNWWNNRKVKRQSIDAAE
ncbi:MAG: deiodinase-like protein [Pseudomonadota bacterium]|nr:deiodinase-like protein [Pseudomonadota bacterium]